MKASTTIALLVLLCSCSGDRANLPQFDTAHVERAIAYLSEPSQERLQRVAETAAARHLLKHSAVTGYYAPDATALDITRSLLSRPVEASEIARVETLLAETEAAPERQRACLRDAARYLPEGFAFAEPLYVTWGYDIGVSMNGSASINLAHPRFAADPDEIWFYCVHEMHHAGLTSLQPYPQAISEIRTAAEMLAFIRYSTMLEGMAVHTAREPRRKAGALESDPDYVALGDPVRMAAYEETFWKIYGDFEAQGGRPLSEGDWHQVEQLSDNDRLWYRVGAQMAAMIEAELGRSALRNLPLEVINRGYCQSGGKSPCRSRRP
ncbi:MAG: hypothetical protein P8Y44_08470 [Acidobacteriota bacterium]